MFQLCYVCVGKNCQSVKCTVLQLRLRFDSIVLGGLTDVSSRSGCTLIFISVPKMQGGAPVKYGFSSLTFTLDILGS